MNVPVISDYKQSDLTEADGFAADVFQHVYDGYRKRLGEELFDVFFDGWQTAEHNRLASSLAENSKRSRAFTLVVGDDIAAMGSYRVLPASDITKVTAATATAVICSNSVRPYYRGKGLGASLCRHMLAVMAKETDYEIKGATVTVDSEDESARRAYERVGFALQVPHVTYYRKNTPPKSFLAQGSAKLTEAGENLRIFTDKTANETENGLNSPDVVPIALAVLPGGGEMTFPAPSEYEEIAALSVKSWEIVWDSHSELLGEDNFELFNRNCRKRKFSDTLSALKNNAGRQFVVRLDGKIAGFCGYHADGRRATVGLNAVSPEFRGKGLGTLMQDFITMRMLGEGIEYAKVSTGSDRGHTAARKAYKRAGFAASLESVTYYIRLASEV